MKFPGARTSQRLLTVSAKIVWESAPADRIWRGWGTLVSANLCPAFGHSKFVRGHFRGGQRGTSSSLIAKSEENLCVLWYKIWEDSFQQ